MFLYHVTPKYNRDSINSGGLIGNSITSIWSNNRKKNWRTRQIGDLQPKGNYGFEFVGPAIEYADILYINKFIERKKDFDIWQFDVSGLEVLYDPEIYLSDPHSMSLLKDDLSPEEIDDCEQGRCDHRKGDRRWYTPSFIEPERLTLLSKENASLLCETEQIERICKLRERAKPFPIWGIGY